MKKMFGVISVAATLAMTGGIASAAGVSDTTVNVPFSFIVGSTELPAGHYVVKETASTADVVALENADGHEYATILTIPPATAESSTTPELVFKKFDDHYFLAHVAAPDGADRDVVLTPAIMQRAIAETATRAN
ncbi:MAG TPA: hypothetical protein VHZ73_04180 [Vicinamibacterales bacterium]|jgi:hypothetical protein|nr:hypothetical protein [Vicinamibacterales bacterium]